jgi:hypothetical protein
MMLGRRMDDRALAETRAVLIFTSAQLLDVATTILGVQSGILSEANPLAAKLFSHSLGFSLGLKMLLATAVVLAVVRFVSPRRRYKTLLILASITLVAPLLNSLQLLAGG